MPTRDNEGESKQCSKCKVWKPRTATYFHRHGRSQDGLRPDCKACALAQKAQYSREHAAEAKARAVQWRAEQREQHRASARQWAKEHPERVRARQRQWKADNPDAVRAMRKRYNDAHQARRRAYNHAWGECTKYWRHYRATHLTQVRVAVRVWLERNPERVQAHRARRRARAEAAGSFTAGEWRALCDWFGNACVACGATGKLSPDHVVPLARSGSNLISNIQPICWDCNQRKHTRTVDYRDRASLEAFLELYCRGYAGPSSSGWAVPA